MLSIKDISRKGGWFSYPHDRYNSCSRFIRPVDMEEMLAACPRSIPGGCEAREIPIPFP